MIDLVLQTLLEKVESSKRIMEDKEKFKKNVIALIKVRHQFLNCVSIIDWSLDICRKRGSLQDLNSSQLPYWRKDAIREKAKTIQKSIDSHEKAARAAIAEKVGPSFALLLSREASSF